MQRFSLLIIIAAALAVSACSGTTSPTPSATIGSDAPSDEPSATASSDAGSLPEGWTTVTVDEEGFSLALPEDWLSASPDDLNSSGAFEELAEENPEARTALEQAQQGIRNGSVKFFAFETGRRTARAGFATNLNVVGVPEPGTASAEQVAQQMASALPLQIPGLEVIGTDTVTLPAGEAAVVESEWTLQQASGPLDLRLTQYLILAGDTGYVLSMTSPAATADRYADTWPDVAASFAVE